MNMEQHCNILAKEMLNDSTVSLTLGVGSMVQDTLSGPGQFVHIRCGEGLLLRRPISVSTYQVGHPDEITLVFGVRGEGTRWLARRPVGHSLDVMGLLGRGFPMKPEGRYLLVGGGIGVPPLLGCAQQSPGRHTAVLGFRSRSMAILLPQFEAWTQHCLVATEDGSLGYAGYVDRALEQVLSQDANFDGLLACGPRMMLKQVAQVAQTFHLPCYVSMEERMGCGVGACLVCACDMKDGSRAHVCHDGPVFDAKEVCWDV